MSYTTSELESLDRDSLIEIIKVDENITNSDLIGIIKDYSEDWDSSEEDEEEEEYDYDDDEDENY